MASADSHNSAGSNDRHTAADVTQVTTAADDSQQTSVESPKAEADSTAAVANQPSNPPENLRRRRIVGTVALGAAVMLGVYLLVPAVMTSLHTVSTDDAYVNGHFTFVAPRVAGQVVRVLVDDNNRVHKGDLLLQLDKEPFEIQVRAQQAAVELAKADLAAAHDDARALVAQARSNRFKLQNAIEQVNNQIAELRANVAALETSRARLVRANADYERALHLQQSPGAISDQEVDRRREAFRVAEAEVVQSLERVHQVRVSLGLPAEPADGQPLATVPEDLDQTFSIVRQALADLLRSAAPLGIFPTSYTATPKQVIEDFYKRDPEGNLDRIFAQIIPHVPEIQQAEARHRKAQSDLDQAQLNLRWCDVYAEIDGQITRRNVNPGNNVQIGQNVMVVRSLTEIWIDANFKETQLDYLRIGQRVDMRVDMYGRSVTFPGRITGFTMGTGSTLALLPAENATGNFIKVVQRLPVRIEPIDYDPDKIPLFVGLSVVPYVQIYEAPRGPHAGEYLQAPMAAAAPSAARPQRQAGQP